MLGDFKRWPQSGAQNNSKDDSMLFFRPFVDELLSSHTGLNISMNFLMIGRKEHEKQMERQLKKLPWTRQHSSRRAVRLEIIAAAEKIWQGIDPFPKEIIDVDTGRIMFERNSAMPADDPYRIYRDRFAPTHKLKEFLFAPAALAENSWEAVYDGTKDWLNDPTTKLRTRADYQNVRPKWIFDNAMMMLNCLTLWRVVRYHRKGYGGAVTNWVEAAVNWHITRMESELRSGSIIRKDHIPPAMKDGHPLPGLFDVREKLGLGVLLDNTTKSLPQQPQRGLTLTCQDYESFNAQERIAAREFHQQVESIKQFNKIVQHTCVRCPLSGWLFYPMGLEGMLAHVRSDHPGLFWEGEPHVLA
ncbi:MAG: hypothetical protein M1827_003857 [Pycnora praestabilis]|nr:MAG: hypothetical protein M1827_003857 [Pycnora praestabilis]